MILDRKLKKRGFFGYNAKDVRMKISEVHDQYLSEQEQLLKEIDAEKQKNQQLKQALNERTEKPITSMIADEISTLLTQQFFEQTNALHQAKIELEAEEHELKDELAKKLQQKNLAQVRLEEALQFLTNLKNDLREELD